MASTVQRFGPWTPELAPLGADGSLIIEGCVHEANGYRPFRNLAPIKTPLTADVLGAAYAKSFAGSVQGFAGTALQLFRLVGGASSFANASRGSGYTTASGERWRFDRFGDLMIATNLTDEVQKFDLNADTQFSDIAAAPRCKFVKVASNFLFTAYHPGQGNRVQWSADGDPTSFPAPGTTPARQVRSGRQDLLGEYGDITGAVTGLTAGTISFFREKAVHTAFEIDDATFVFSFEAVEVERGCIAPDSIVQVGGEAFYIGPDGFYAFNGSNSRPIGNSTFDRFFYEAVDLSRIANVRGALDSKRKIIIWSFQDVEADGVILNKHITYNWETGEPTFLPDLELQVPVDILPASLTLEDIAGSIDDVPGSLDDPVFQGGGLFALGAFDKDRALATFTGETLPARFSTPEDQLVDDGRSFIRYARPIIDGAPSYVALKGREKAEDDAVTIAGADTNSQGRALLRSKTRYSSFEVRVPGGVDWKSAHGVEVVFDEAADRAPSAATTPTVTPDSLLTDRSLGLLTETGVELEAAV